MAIQMRRGLRKDFDPNKMLPGEWAVSIDSVSSNQIVWMCFAAGICKRMGTYEDFQSMINEISGDIINQYKTEFNAILAEVNSAASMVENNKNEVAIIKTSITDTYLPQIQQYVEQAEAAAITATQKATEAAQNATVAEQHASTAFQESEKALAAASEAKQSAESASISASNASISESNAAYAERDAETAMNNAKSYQNAARSYSSNAADSALNASESAKDAADSATIATNKATEVTGYADLSKSYAVGTDNVVRENDATDNAKSYYEQVKNIAKVIEEPCKQSFIFDITDSTNHWETLIRISGKNTPISFVLRTVTEDWYNTGMVIRGTSNYVGLNFTCNSMAILDNHITAIGKVSGTDYYDLAVKIADMNAGMKIILDVYTADENTAIHQSIITESSLSDIALVNNSNLTFTFTAPIEIIDTGKEIVSSAEYQSQCIRANNNVFWFSIDDDKYELQFGSTNDYAEFFPASWGGDIDLGSAIDGMWRNIYAQTSVISTSDRTQKENIEELGNDVKAFIIGLKPSSYKLVKGTSDRTHYGLIAQDVEELLNTLGMDSKDFAGFIKSPKYIWKEEIVIDENGTPVLDSKGVEKTQRIKELVEGEYTYSLRYEEFIAPLIKMVQIQQREIEELKNIVEELKKQ